jgi:hypothetical protein
MSSPEAPASRLAVVSQAARIFSLTISLASRRALLPPSISFIIRSATTPFASNANIIKELNIRCLYKPALPRRKSGNGSELQLDRQIGLIQLVNERTVCSGEPQHSARNKASPLINPQSGEKAMEGLVICTAVLGLARCCWLCNWSS